LQKRPLRMRRLSGDELGVSRQNQIFIFNVSPDPYVNLVVYLDAQPLRKLIASRREQTGKPITMVHAFNKLLGLCFTENPEFNCVVLGGKVYQLETITIANPFLLPGDERALTMLLIDEPQSKSLEQVHDDMALIKQQKLAEYAEHGHTRIGLAPKLYMRSGLYRITSEKRQFKTVYERSLTTNLVLSKANNASTQNFVATKSAMQRLRTFMRFFLHREVEQPQVVDGQVVARYVIPLTLVLDHRLIDGAHANALVSSLNRIMAKPEDYL